MPIERRIGKYDPELGKVVWSVHDDTPPESTAPAVEGIKEIKAVGLPGQPTFTSRKSYEKAVRDAGCVIVGNETSEMSPEMRGQSKRDLIRQSQEARRRR